MDLAVIFLPIGIVTTGVSILAMSIITYRHILYKERGYSINQRSDHKYMITQERLEGAIPQYGGLLFIGLIIIICSLVITT